MSFSPVVENLECISPLGSNMGVCRSTLTPEFSTSVTGIRLVPLCLAGTGWGKVRRSQWLFLISLYVFCA
jgi:hypothetical protein